MISQLKLEMNNLTRLVEAGAGLSIGEEATMNELLKQKEDLTKERDAQVLALSCIPPAMSAQNPAYPDLTRVAQVAYPATVTISSWCYLWAPVMPQPFFI